jgi:hypothetical protein
MKIKINNQGIDDYRKVQNTGTSRSDLSLPTLPLSTDNSRESSPLGLRDTQPTTMRDLIDHTQTRWEHTSSKGNNLQNPNFLGLGVRKNEMTLKAINSQGTTELRKMVDHSTSQDIPDSARKRRKSVTNQGGNLKKNESLAEKSKTKASSWRNFMKTNSDDRSDSADEVVDDQRMLYSHRSVGKSQRELIHVAKDQIDNIIELKGYRIIYPWNI